MKSSYSIISLGPKAGVPAGENSAGRWGHELRNLRPEPGIGIDVRDYVAVGKALCNSAAKGWRVISGCSRSGKRGVAACRGTELGFFGNIASGTPAITDLGSEVRCGLELHSGGVLAMCADGPRELDSNGKACAAVADFPAVVLRAVPGSGVQAQVGDRVLSRAYTAATRLTDSDNRILCGDYVDAYRRLVADAAAAGEFIQPVLARYRLLDEAGRVLFTSAPVLLSHPEGSPCSSAHSLYSADGMTVKGYTLAATTWKLAVDTAPTADARALGVAAVEILATPQFHPYNPNVAAYASLGRLVDSTTPWAHVSLPGRAAGLGMSFGDSSVKRLTEALARMESLEKVLARISLPFSSTGMTRQPACAPESDVDSEARELVAAMRKGVVSTPSAKVMLSAPHGFVARRCSAGAGVVAWADIEVKHYHGFPAGCFASAVEYTAGRVSISVKFADNKGLTRTEELPTLFPVEFGPVLSYPSPEAVEMTITTYCAGVTRRRSFALQPDMSGRRAVYVEPGLKRITLPVSSGISVSDLVAPQLRYAGTVAFATTGRPLDIQAYTVLGSESIEALGLMRNNDSTWEFGRERFIVATGSRIFSLAVNTANWHQSAKVLLSRGINSPYALTAAGTDHYALSGNSLLKIDSRGTVSLTDYADEGSHLAFDSSRGELWAIGNAGWASVYCTADKAAKYMRTCPTAASIGTADGLCYADTAEGLLCIGSEEKGRDVEVGFTTFGSAPNFRPFRPISLSIGARTSAMMGEFTLSDPDSQGEAERRIASFKVQGPARAALRFEIVYPPLRMARLDFSGLVNADFRIRDIDLLTVKGGAKC